MKGHNYGNIACKKCGKIHIHPRGMLRGHSWNTGLTKETDDRLKKISEKAVGQKRSEETKRKMRKSRLTWVAPTKDTSIEIALQMGLDDKNIIYEKHLPVCNCCQPDIIFPKKKIAIFADGDYWHNLPNVIEKDRRQENILKENNWGILRFWEHDIKNNLDICINKILGAL